MADKSQDTFWSPRMTLTVAVCVLLLFSFTVWVNSSHVNTTKLNGSFSGLHNVTSSYIYTTNDTFDINQGCTKGVQAFNISGRLTLCYRCVDEKQSINDALPAGAYLCQM
jgi:hypothetical protein